MNNHAKDYGLLAWTAFDAALVTLSGFLRSKLHQAKTTVDGLRPDAPSAGFKAVVPGRSDAGILDDVRIAVTVAAGALVFAESPSLVRDIAALVLALYGLFAVAQRSHWRKLLKASPAMTASVDLLVLGSSLAVTGDLMSPLLPFMMFPVMASRLLGEVNQAWILGGASMAYLAGIAALSDYLPSLRRPGGMELGGAILGLLMAFLVARWSYRESMLVRLMALINQLGQAFNRRHGADQGVLTLAHLLCDYFGADACFFTVRNCAQQGSRFYQVHPKDSKRRPTSVPVIDAQVALPQGPLLGQAGVIYSTRRLFGNRVRGTAFDTVTLQGMTIDQGPMDEIANLLEVSDYMSVPVRSRNTELGRVYVASNLRRFTRKDLSGLAQIVGQASLMIENMQIIDRLAADVAVEERRRISRDLHDSTIQPYIGLKLGLEALQRRAVGGPLGRELDELTRMANDGIGYLRNYVGALKETDRAVHQEPLLPAILNQSRRFAEFYGVRAEVSADSEVSVPGPLHEDLIHIVREALSNVRRHTSAQDAIIRLRSSGQQLCLEFINENDGGTSIPDFCPRSIWERVIDLHGQTRVEQRAGGRTAVVVEIPLA